MSSINTFDTKSLPEQVQCRSGIGLREPHFEEILKNKPNISWLEAHSENYFDFGGVPHQYLKDIAQHYPISLHCIGLSLGSADGIDGAHLTALNRLVDEIDPIFVSDHLSWSGYDGRAVPDLLPLPFTEEALSILTRNIDLVQTTLNRQIFIENPSGYLDFIEQDMREPEFLNTLASQTGCGLLLDINNIHVSGQNIGFDTYAYIDTIDPKHVKECHLAGYQVNIVDDKEFLIDAHNNPIYDPVWALYDYAISKLGDIPTLIEWDADIPALSVLEQEAQKADHIRDKHKSAVSQEAHKHA